MILITVVFNMRYVDEYLATILNLPADWYFSGASSLWNYSSVFRHRTNSKITAAVYWTEFGFTDRKLASRWKPKAADFTRY